MNSIKCPNCGLVNFATADTCKRCKQNLEGPSYPYWQGNSAVAPPAPDWSRLQPAAAEDLSLPQHADPGHPVGNIIFAVYLALNAMVLLYAVYFFSSESMGEVLKVVTNPNTRLYLATFEPFYYFVMLGVVIFLPATIILFVRLCQKSTDFLRCVVIYLLAEFVYSLVQGCFIFSLKGDLQAKQIAQFDVAANQFTGLLGLQVISILFTFIWFRYFTTSRRARAVFEFELSATHT